MRGVIMRVFSNFFNFTKFRLLLTMRKSAFYSLLQRLVSLVGKYTEDIIRNLNLLESLDNSSNIHAFMQILITYNPGHSTEIPHVVYRRSIMESLRKSTILWNGNAEHLPTPLNVFNSSRLRGYKAFMMLACAKFATNSNYSNFLYGLCEFFI